MGPTYSWEGNLGIISHQVRGPASCLEPLLLAGTPAPCRSPEGGVSGAHPDLPSWSFGDRGGTFVPPGSPMSQVGMPFFPLAAVALGLTLADGELGTATLTPLPVHQDTGATCRWAGEQRLGGRWGAGGTGGVGTHSGNAGFLVVAHTPVHGSHDEDVFRLGLTVKQGGGGDFACRTEGWGGPGRGQGRKERVRDMGTMWQHGCKCVSVCVHVLGVWGGALEGREGSTHALGTRTSEMAI